MDEAKLREIEALATEVRAGDYIGRVERLAADVPALAAALREQKGDAHRQSLKLAEALDCPYIDDTSLLATARRLRDRALAAEKAAGEMRAALKAEQDHYDECWEGCLEAARQCAAEDDKPQEASWMRTAAAHAKRAEAIQKVLGASAALAEGGAANG